MSAAPELFADRVVAVHHALEQATIDHAFGGALALAYYAVPRVTVDVDVNVFVDLDGRSQVRAALEPLGVAFGPAVTAERDGWERTDWDKTPIDIFYAHDAIHLAMRDRRRLFPFAGFTLPYLAPEHLAACKAIFGRDKDWPDIDQMLKATPDLDVDEAVRWISYVVGDDDWRLARFLDAIRRVRG